MGDVDAPQPPEIRVGDRERRETDERLRLALDDGVLTLAEYDERAALCWAARTRRDLDALVADLPAPHPKEPVTEKLPAPAVRMPDQQTRKRVVTGLAAAAVLGVGLIFGVPALGAADGMSLFGSREISAADQSDVEVGVLFGSVRVVVPDDAHVRTSGTVVFGSLNCEEACSAGPGREVTVNGGGAFGSVNVVRQSERDREVQQEIAEEEQERLQELREDAEDN
ncbi:hypothetical protein BJF78_35690 [Pseudonocardia sp. CNS-139]|nr:hypothetical protein BJF78_35690 [Pseudonocardia sp. CNS-139]